MVFCGHSGVGKTSLLNRLLGASNRKVGDVSEFTGKGKHTTTSAVLLEGSEEGKWIDTPGVRAFGLVGLVPEELKNYFPEFSDLPCSEHGCSHIGEPDCQAATTPRYANYRRIFESLQAGEG